MRARPSHFDISRFKPEVQLIAATGAAPRPPLATWSEFGTDCWAIDYVYEGQLLQRIGRGQAALRAPGVAYLWAPKTRYAQRSPERFMNCYAMFRMTGRTKREFLGLVGAAGYWHILDGDGLAGERLRTLAETMFRRLPGFHLRAYGILLDLLGLIQEAELVRRQTRVVRKIASPERERTMRRQVERYVVDHLGEPIHATDLAQYLGISASTLSHTYPRFAGETPLETVQRIRIDEVKRLMLGEGLSVKTCADRLGFSSPFQLSRVFKRIEGISPRRYQRSLTRDVR